jgi:chromosome segregation ATPase
LRKLKDVVASKDARVDELGLKVKTLTAELKDAQQETEEISATLRQKQTDLTAQLETAAALRKSLRNKEGTVDSSTDRIADLEGEAVRKDALVAESKRRVSALQTELDAIEHANASDAASLSSEAHRTAASNARAVDALRTQLAERDQALQQHTVRIQTLSAELQSSQQSVAASGEASDAKEAAHAALTAKLNGRIQVLASRGEAAAGAAQQSSDQMASAAAKAHVTERTLLESQVAQLHSQAESKGKESTRQLESVRTELRKQTEAKNAATLRVQLLETSATTRDTEVARLKSDLEVAEQELESSQTAAAKMKLRCDKLEREAASGKSVVTLAEQQRSALDLLVTTLRQTLKEKESQMFAQRTQAQERDDQLATKSELVIRASAEAAALRVKHSAAAATLEAVRAEHTAALAAATTKLATASSRADAAETLARDRQKALTRASDRAEDAEDARLLGEKRAAADVQRLQSALARTEDDLQLRVGTLAQASKDVKATAAAVEDAESRATSAESELRRLMVKEATARAELEKLADEHAKTVIRLRREEANAASHKYTADAQGEQIKALKGDRDEIQSRFEVARAQSGDAVRESATHAAKAEAALTAAEKRAASEVNAAEEQGMALMQAQAKLELLSTELTSCKDTRDTLQRRCDDLESQSTMTAAAMDALQSAHTEATAQADAAAAKLVDAETQLIDMHTRVAEVASDLAASGTELVAAHAAREKAENDLQAAIVEHLLVSKKQQQHAAELKKTLQQSLKGQAGALPGAASGGTANSDSAADGGGNGGSSAATPMHSLAAPGGIGPASLPRSPAAPLLSDGHATPYPDHLEVNFEYLKNIIIRYVHLACLFGAEITAMVVLEAATHQIAHMLLV